MKAALQAKNIPAATVIEIVRRCNEGKCEHQDRGEYIDGKGHWCLIWDLTAALNLPEKVVRAKLRRLMQRGDLKGCNCGCRGDFELP